MAPLTGERRGLSPRLPFVLSRADPERSEGPPVSKDGEEDRGTLEGQVTRTRTRLQPDRLRFPRVHRLITRGARAPRGTHHHRKAHPDILPARAPPRPMASCPPHGPRA